MKILLTLGLLLVGVSLGCGSASEHADEDDGTQAASSSGGELETFALRDAPTPPAPADEGDAGDDEADIVFEGLLGSLDEQVIRAQMDAHVADFSRCFEARYADNELLAGHADLSFRVRTNGRVRSVHMKTSTIGDRQVEHCIVAVARRLVFSPGPQGGEAEFTEAMSSAVPGELRPPGELSRRRVASLVRANGARVRGACHVEGEGLHATVYVDNRGRVVSVGAAVDAPGQEDALDCVAARIVEWSFPDPGSYDAKATFEL